MTSGHRGAEGTGRALPRGGSSQGRPMVNPMVNPLDGAPIDVDDIDNLIELIEASRAVIESAIQSERVGVAHLVRLTAAQGRAVRVARGRRREATIDMLEPSIHPPVKIEPATTGDFPP